MSQSIPPVSPAFFRSILLPQLGKRIVAALLAIALAYGLGYPPVSAMMLIFFTLLAVQTTIGGTLWFIKPLGASD